MEHGDAEFTGEHLVQLVIAIETQIGRYRAGCTPLGRAVTDLCEEAVARDRAKTPQS